MNDQRSLYDQLKDLKKMAVSAGLYDADDYLRNVIENIEAGVGAKSAAATGYAGPGSRARLCRTEKIELLEEYSLWLEKNGYMDVDWRAEQPLAVGEFMDNRAEA